MHGMEEGGPWGMLWAYFFNTNVHSYFCNFIYVYQMMFFFLNWPILLKYLNSITFKAKMPYYQVR